MLKLFAAITPPKAIISQINPLFGGIEDIGWIPQENLHITIGYFGKTDMQTAEILDRNLNNNPGGGFELQLSGIGTFGNNRTHTIWLGLAPSQELQKLHQHVLKSAKKSGIEMEKRKYVPHLSLAYPRKKINQAELAHYLHKNIAFRSRPFLVDSFALFSSHQNKKGANTYKKEANYPLLG